MADAQANSDGKPIKLAVTGYFLDLKKYSTTI
jgi:hypothetical protein